MRKWLAHANSATISNASPEANCADGNGKSLATVGVTEYDVVLDMNFRAPVFLLLLASCSFGLAAAEAEAVFTKAPKPLSAKAVTSDWPGFLGPLDQPISKETHLLPELPDTGLNVVWEMPKGAGYASPVVVGDRLVYFHRLTDSGKEQIVCLHPETGKRYWAYDYAVEYQDRYGYASGPRASAVISGDQVFTFGVTSWVHALDLKTGKVLWKHDCAATYGVPQYFFGSGSSPLIVEDVVMVNLGGNDQLCVIGFDRKSGEVKWKTKHEWGQSYASPVPVTFHGKSRVVVFAGGEGKPSTGGLISIDPKTGSIDDTFFWRADRYTSVNAASPTLCGPNRVFVTQAYVDRGSECNGGAMVEMTPEMKWKVVWKAEDLGCHWMTPVFHEGHLYAFSGEKENACDLVCYDAATGKLLWKESPTWDLTLRDGRKLPLSFKRGSLLLADGKFLCLGEWGTLAWLDLSPKGMKILSKMQPFLSQQSWTLPALSKGLLYLSQHEKDEMSGQPARLLCVDFRAP